MKILKFYKLYDWIIAEMGLSADAGIIAVIHSFAEMGKECRMSYADFADVLKVSRRKAIDRVKRLREDGYITATVTSSDDSGNAANVYTVKYAKFGRFRNSDETVTTPSDETVTTPSDETVTTPSDETVTTLVTKPSPPTITENKKRSNREGGENTRRESDTSLKPETAPQNSNEDSEKPLILSDKEEDYIRFKVDYSRPKPTNTHKHSAEHYIELVTSRQYPLARVLRFLRDDYHILSDEEAQRRKTKCEHDSSLQSAIEGLINRF